MLGREARRGGGGQRGGGEWRQRRLKNLNLYLDLSKEKGCKMCRIWWI